MSTLGLRRIRIAVDTSKFNGPSDLLTGQSVKFWRSSDLQFELGLFYGAALLTNIAALQSLTLQIKPLGESGGAPDPATAPLMSATITTFNGALTSQQWADGTHQHAVVSFSGTASNIAAGKKWIVLTAVLISGAVVTLLAGECECAEDGYNSAGSAAVLDDTAWTKAESDARYPMVGMRCADWRPTITALTGGGASALDGIATAALSPGYLVALRIGGIPHWYVLEAGTAAEASPATIRPDDFALSTNEKIWTRYL
jgi:hypothetical protein